LQNHKITHAKIINTDDYDNPFVLIGHEIDVLIAKFSRVTYIDQDKLAFNILASVDRGGNMILWKIANNTFTVLAEIISLSEATIHSLCWYVFFL